MSSAPPTVFQKRRNHVPSRRRGVLTPAELPRQLVVDAGQEGLDEGVVRHRSRPTDSSGTSPSPADEVLRRQCAQPFVQRASNRGRPPDESGNGPPVPMPATVIASRTGRRDRARPASMADTDRRPQAPAAGRPGDGQPAPARRGQWPHAHVRPPRWRGRRSRHRPGRRRCGRPTRGRRIGEELRRHRGRARRDGAPKRPPCLVSADAPERRPSDPRRQRAHDEVRNVRARSDDHRPADDHVTVRRRRAGTLPARWRGRRHSRPHHPGQPGMTRHR